MKTVKFYVEEGTGMISYKVDGAMYGFIETEHDETIARECAYYPSMFTAMTDKKALARCEYVRDYDIEE